MFHVYIMLAGVTTYEYIRQQRLVERVQGGEKMTVKEDTGGQGRRNRVRPGGDCGENNSRQGNGVVESRDVQG